MNAKILVSLLTIGVASAALGYGTYAAFSSTATSTGNVFSVGTVELTLAGAESVDAFIGGDDLAPGDEATGSLVLKNTGSIFTGDARGHSLTLRIEAANTNATLAQALEIVSITYDGEPLTDGESSPATLADLAAMTFDVADPGAAGKTLEIAVRLSWEADNTVQGLSNTLQFTFTLAQLVPAR
jgi:spore coat-associated protein N